MAEIKGRAKIIPDNRDAIFLMFQSRWITDTARLKLMVKSRQIGISWSTAFASVERTAAQGARHDEWVSSRDDIQAAGDSWSIPADELPEHTTKGRHQLVVPYTPAFQSLAPMVKRSKSGLLHTWLMREPKVRSLVSSLDVLVESVPAPVEVTMNVIRRSRTSVEHPRYCVESQRAPFASDGPRTGAPHSAPDRP